MTVILIGILLVFMIIGAIIAVETDDLLSAIISVGAVGFGLSVVFLLLQAPDVAMTQIVVEILVLVILIRATISRDLTFISGPREFFGMVVAISLVLVLLLVGVRVFEHLPAFGEPVMENAVPVCSRGYLTDCLSGTGSTNVVTAILLDFRAHDTLGEGTILFTALLGVLVVLRKQARRRKKEGEEE